MLRLIRFCFIIAFIIILDIISCQVSTHCVYNFMALRAEIRKGSGILGAENRDTHGTVMSMCIYLVMY